MFCGTAKTSAVPQGRRACTSRSSLPVLFLEEQVVMQSNLNFALRGQSIDFSTLYHGVLSHYFKITLFVEDFFYQTMGKKSLDNKGHIQLIFSISWKKCQVLGTYHKIWVSEHLTVVNYIYPHHGIVRYRRASMWNWHTEAKLLFWGHKGSLGQETEF